MIQSRQAFSLVEVLLAVAILGSSLVVAYGLLQSDYRFGMDLPNRTTADTLARNMMDRYHHMSGEELLALAGGEGVVEVSTLQDPTLAGVDPRTGEELDRLGFVRTLEVSRRRGPMGGVAFMSRVSWPSLGGRREAFEYGVASYAAEEAIQKSGTPSGFDPRIQKAGWGHAKTWERTRRQPSEAGPSLRGGAPRYEERDPAQDTVSADYRPGQQARPTLPGDPDSGLLRGLARPERPPTPEKSQAQREQVEARLARILPGPLGQVELREIPDGEYRYAVEVLEMAPGHTLGVIHLWGDHRAAEDAGEHLLIARRIHQPPRFSLRGDLVLETRPLEDSRQFPWILLRTVDRIFLAERRGGVMPDRMILETLENMDGGATTGTATTREIDRRLEAHQLRPAGGNPEDLLAAAPPTPGNPD